MYEKIWNQNKIAFGGDYNPEQWDEATWEEDMHLFGLAHIDTVTLNVFSWAMLQPDESTYDFTKLDRIMELVKKNGLKVVLATSTGAHPAWMANPAHGVQRNEAQVRWQTQFLPEQSRLPHVFGTAGGEAGGTLQRL